MVYKQALSLSLRIDPFGYDKLKPVFYQYLKLIDLSIFNIDLSLFSGKMTKQIQKANLTAKYIMLSLQKIELTLK